MRPRHALALGILFAFWWLGGPQTLSSALGCLLGWIAAMVALNVTPWLNARDERRRLAADCDAQHDAWKRGDDLTAYFGHYPPPKPWVIVTEDQSGLHLEEVHR